MNGSLLLMQDILTPDLVVEDSNWKKPDNQSNLGKYEPEIIAIICKSLAKTRPRVETSDVPPDRVSKGSCNGRDKSKPVQDLIVD